MTECIPGEISLCDLISAEYRDVVVYSRRLQALLETEKDHLIKLVRESWKTCHLTLTELLLKAELGHVCKVMILKALNSQGMKAYIDDVSKM